MNIKRGHEMISFTPVWFDSMGAKSSCTLVETPDTKVLIDPGIAVMQPSFPASDTQKSEWEKKGRKAIKKAASKADVLTISHYHYDHYMPEDIEIYRGKLVLAKNPNEYINDSQRKRAEHFYAKLFRKYGKIYLEKFLDFKNERKGNGSISQFTDKANARGLELVEKKGKYPNPMKNLPLSSNMKFGDYDDRRKELLKKGYKSFGRRVENWKEKPAIPEAKFNQLELRFADGKSFSFGKTKIRITDALFHGIEFSRVGWAFSTVIEHGKKKLLHSSDLSGPIVEDYAKWIIDENPDILVMDGPMTYMYGYLLNKTNLKRALDNMVKIVKETDTETIIYDHHLTREKNFKKHTKRVRKAARETGKEILTAAEYLGQKTKILEITE